MTTDKMMVCLDGTLHGGALLEITVNDEPRTVPKGACVESLMHTSLLAGREQIAVALNDEVVPRAEWRSRRLAHGDALLIIVPAQGG